MRKALFISVSLLSLALAGCSSDGDDPGGGNDLGLQPTETTGIIQGVVVDDAIQPVVGATITLVGQDMATTTDRNGSFGFDGLEPGEYFLKASKLGYFDAQQSTTVVAGVADPPMVKILLEVNPEDTPFYEEDTWTGYIECTTGIVAACGLLDNPITGQPTNDDFGHTFFFQPGADLIQFEMVWDSTQALSPEMYFELELSPGGDFLNNTWGESPIYATVNQTQVDQFAIGGDVGIFASVFSQGVDPTGFVGVTVQQEFTFFVHAFHNYLPPDGWRFTDNNEVPPPPQ